MRPPKCRCKPPVNAWQNGFCRFLPSGIGAKLSRLFYQDKLIMNNIQSVPNFSRATGTRIDCIISEIMQIRKDWPVEPDISRNFIDWDHSALTEIRTALVEAARGSFSGEAGEKGLGDHLFR